MTKVGINGFGRIGRLAFRAALKRNDIEVVGINDLVDPEYLVYEQNYESTHRKYNSTVEVKDKNLSVHGNTIRLTAAIDPANLNWTYVGAENVIESTGLFLNLAHAQK